MSRWIISLLFLFYSTPKFVFWIHKNIQAMKAVDRANYVHDTADAYFDSPQLRFPSLFIWNNEPHTSQTGRLDMALLLAHPTWWVLVSQDEAHKIETGSWILARLCLRTSISLHPSWFQSSGCREWFRISCRSLAPPRQSRWQGSGYRPYPATRWLVYWKSKERWIGPCVGKWRIDDCLGWWQTWLRSRRCAIILTCVCVITWTEIMVFRSLRCYSCWCCSPNDPFGLGRATSKSGAHVYSCGNLHAIYRTCRQGCCRERQYPQGHGS